MNSVTKLRAGETQTCRMALIAAAVVGMSLSFTPADASTIDTFTWVDAPGETGSGTLTLTLPGTVTPNGSGAISSGPFTTAQAFADLTAFSFQFSSGLTVGLANLTSDTFTNSSGTAITSGINWATSNSVAPLTGGTGVGTTDLITGFIFTGSNNLKISESLGSGTNIGFASNQINPATGGVANDAGYWKLTSTVTTPVPLPAALPLLFSGIGGLMALARKRKAR